MPHYAKQRAHGENISRYQYDYELLSHVGALYSYFGLCRVTRTNECFAHRSFARCLSGFGRASQRAAVIALELAFWLSYASRPRSTKATNDPRYTEA